MSDGATEKFWAGVGGVHPVNKALREAFVEGQQRPWRGARRGPGRAVALVSEYERVVRQNERLRKALKKASGQLDEHWVDAALATIDEALTRE
jgi:hypothetical protein